MVNPRDYEGTHSERGQYLTRWLDRKKPRVQTDWKEAIDSCFEPMEIPTIEDYPELKRLYEVSK